LLAKVDPALMAVIVADILIIGLVAAILMGRQMARQKRSLIPIGLRPGPSDEELERSSLIRNLLAGALIFAFFMLFFPLYFLREPTRIASMEKFFKDQATTEGAKYFAATGDPNNLLAVGCANCHGASGEGGLRQFKGHTYAEPPLKYIVARYKAAGRNDEDIKLLIRDAIERGRPGTPMPTWGLQYGGPLHSQQVDFLMAFIYSIQEPFPEASGDGASIFAKNCAVCHGDKGEGGTGPNLQVAFQRLTEDQVRETIMGGRLNTNRPSMPAWAGLGQDAVNALVEFLKSIQRVPVK
jgi:mono/diheme cytochrome c family protein